MTVFFHDLFYHPFSVCENFSSLMEGKWLSNVLSDMCRHEICFLSRFQFFFGWNSNEGDPVSCLSGWVLFL